GAAGTSADIFRNGARKSSLSAHSCVTLAQTRPAHSLHPREVPSMRRTLLTLGGMLGVALVAVLVSLHTSSRAQPPRTDPARDAKGHNGSVLPLAQVILFNTGVGYFQREGH